MTTIEEDIIPDEPKELFEHYRIIVDKGQALLRIDKFLTTKIENTSRNKIQKAAEADCILVNNNPVSSNYRVKPCDVISVVLPTPPRDNVLIPENIPLDIVYEDDDLLIVNKKAGMVVHPGFNNYTGTLVNALAWHLKDLPLFSSGDMRPGLVHRIDKDTSGLLVIAKTEFALMHLAKQFYDHTSVRRYIAIVWGNLPDDEGTIIGNIGRNPKNRIQMTVFPPDSDEGKPAITHYKVLERLSYINVVECRLETGRTHQIRAHFKSIGHPLFNDEVYGGNEILKGTTFSKYKQFVQNCFNILPRQALHAKTIGFMHPTLHKNMHFESELPEDMNNLLERWRIYIAGRS